MSKVFVLDTKKRPLLPCHPAKARILLKQGKAAVYRRYPFTIILKQEIANPEVQPLRLKIDPGSKTTGLAIINDTIGEVIFAGELHHRGEEIKEKLTARRSLRRARRNRKTRYRAPRFLNRHPEKCASCGKNAKHGSRYCRLCHETRNFIDNDYRKIQPPPSLQSRIANVITWVKRIRRYCPIQAITMELVRFDLQKIENPEIQGIKYQQGTLYGYEVKEYLLEKYSHQCVYCRGKSGDSRLEIEHVVPKNPRHGPAGTDRVSNLVIACETCNKSKNNLQPQEWLNCLQASGSPLDRERAKNLPQVLRQLKQSLKDATAVNTTRWALFKRLKELELPLETGSGGRTKYNRVQMGLPKVHWIDAACVGASTPEYINIDKAVVLEIKAMGHGRRQRCGTDRYGFPTRHASRAKTHLGYQTGDIVKAIIPKGKHAGIHVGRIVIRHRPSFKLNGFDVHPKYLRPLQKADGYEYMHKRG